MFLLNGSPLQVDVAFSYNGIKYPQNWLRLSTLAEKEAIGITEVADPVRPDDRFYYVDGNGHGVPKDLDGLKKTWSSQVDQTAYSMLFTSDWMVVRKQEVGTDIPADWLTYRSAIRTAAATNKANLNGAADFDAFVTVATSLQWPVSPDAVIS
jgi:hypothetical protein